MKDDRWNAVFKGGGAKGIAYAGALKACEERGVEFKAVAGSSAGAITATLVACGYTAAETMELMPDALAAIDNVPSSMAKIGTRPSVLDSADLHHWLARAIAHKIKGKDNYDPADPPECTFAEIREKTQISLYVVTLDLAENQPLVFGPEPRLTPESPVAPAVVASSAIPVAFPASRMDVDGSVHRLVDGGTWSNYPSFVFLDHDFRNHHGLDETNDKMIGFILDAFDDDPARPSGSPAPQRGSALIGDRGSSTNKFSLGGAVMSSTLFRWSVGLAPILFVMLSLLWVRRELTSDDPLIDAAPDQVHDLIVVGSIAVLAVTGIAALIVAFVVVRLGRTLFDTGVVGASAAMGVGPGVAYWVGRGREDDYSSDHVAVRIKVPKQLTTLRFDAPDPLRVKAFESGHTATAEALAKVDVSVRADPETPGDTRAELDLPESTPRRVEHGWFSELTGPVRRLLGKVLAPIGWLLRKALVPIRWLLERVLVPIRWLFGLAGHRYLRWVALAYAIIGGTSAAFQAMVGFAGGHTFRTAFWVAVVGSAVGAAVWLLAEMRSDEADPEIEHPYPWFAKLKRPALLHAVSAVAVLVAILTALGSGALGETSFFTSLRAGELSGEVDGVIECLSGPDTCQEVDIVVREPDIDDGEFDTFLELLFFAEDREDAEIAAFADDPEFASDADQFTLADLQGDDVDLFLLEDDFVESEDAVLVVLETESGLPATNEVTLRVNIDERLVFLDQDLDTNSSARVSFQLSMIMLLALSMLAFRARRAAKWLAQNRDDAPAA